MRGESLGYEESWCEWFKCTDCGWSNIKEHSKYCPDCGSPTSENDITESKLKIAAQELLDYLDGNAEHGTSQEILIEKLREALK